ncbi:NusG domain II-containing protein [Helcococcus ovis]|uniref:NusG domain II-containing protein n=1 Tax=Helcococcus ovis TaxID=72026 RepID=A0A4R9C1A7_9FIRM|nr:NusG domain II-containing protein [Helcococcus ovis]TFF63885.1 NusG domain II-containing protein [Helcococcus ovis]TFF64444.1 NusG domain II-containing protein [Helcococcus ovis]TFF67063.1 NusG domain II-containing protein [Helcococcus ovis]WNZ01803.1 NusG domain II-containing protein [Helcococcus ovis]
MKLTKGDKILILILVIFSLLFAFYITNVNKKVTGKYVSIQVNGEEINAIRFSKDIIGKKYTIKTKYGKNVIEFGDDELKIIESSCLDKLCIKQGKISQVGQLLVCLPNRLVIEIRTDSQDKNNLDSMVF